MKGEGGKIPTADGAGTPAQTRAREIADRSKIGRGRPRKTLVELVRDDAFRRDRHAALLESERLPEEPPEWAPRELWRKLRHAQARYLEEGETGLLRRDYLDAFSRGVRALHGGRLPWLLGGP